MLLQNTYLVTRKNLPNVETLQGNDCIFQHEEISNKKGFKNFKVQSHISFLLYF